MRDGFLQYVSDKGKEVNSNEPQMDQILDPNKFIERHFGNNPEILYN